VGNDSAIIIIEFKKAGSVISTTQITYRNVSGSISTFTPFSFPLSSIPEAPDSVIVGMTSSNLQGTGLQSGSWVEIDELAFGGTGITQPIPGGSFDNWNTQYVDDPVGWEVQVEGNLGTGINRSSTHYSGNYSIQLTSQLNSCNNCNNSVQAAWITTGYFTPNNGPAGGLPYTIMVDTLTGYYMYLPAGLDTAYVSVNMYSGTTMVGSFMHNLFAASSWTYFEQPIFASSTPDTLRIDVQSSSWNAQTPGSVLYLDYMQLKSQPLPPVNVNGIAPVITGVTAYPNPAVDVLNIRLNYYISEPFNVMIYDMMGRILEKVNYNTQTNLITLPVAYLPAGMYFYQVTNNSNIIRGKFLKN
jgi:hypothetical protein